MSTNQSSDDLHALAERLRSLPNLPVPSGLEAKLLAAIPDAGMLAARSRRRWGRLWLGGALAAAAVLLLILGYFLAKIPATQDHPVPDPLPRPQVVTDPPRRENDRQADLEASSFEWPVQLTVPVTTRHLPADLTD